MQSAFSDPIPFEHYAKLFGTSEGTDATYLRDHFPRYLRTRREILSRWNRKRGNRMLDVGAHWLHQAMLYAIDGFAVTALDLPATFEMPNVRETAREHEIRLLANADLENAAALRDVPDDSFDLILFTEVIEHITFNPVAMWREIYRVMKPGARIVITTPNHYALRVMVRRWFRAIRGEGGGTSVSDIVTLRTLSHHWKEYSMRELVSYFALLSPDFVAGHRTYLMDLIVPPRQRLRGRIATLLERAIPFLRPGLYLEIDLPRKVKGIVVEPHW